MLSSPFSFGKTVSLSAFINREVETERLKNNMLSGINTTVISPRRWGKSSLVEKVIHDIRRKDKKTIMVVIDLFYVSSEEEFLELFARELIKASSTRYHEWVKAGRDFFKHLIPKISVGIDPMSDFSLSFDWHEIKLHYTEILDLPETIAQKKGVNVIVCLDEFQNIAMFRDYEPFEKKLRAAWQRHKRTTYCLYGSRRHIMSDIFNKPSTPFYRFGDIIMLQKIATEKWVTFMVQSFAKTGKEITSEYATVIASVMKNHPWYVQQLAHYTWNKTSQKVDQQTINEALNELINTNTPLYQKEIDILSVTQMNFLKAVVNGVKQFTSTSVMSEYHLGTPRNVSKNKTILMNNDLVHHEEGTLTFVDPAFELWFRNYYFKQKYVT